MTDLYISLVTWERHQYLEKSLQSLSRCNFPPDFHIVITDDKSEDSKVLESIYSFKERVKDRADVEVRVRPKRTMPWVNNVENMKYCLSKTKDDHVICLQSDGLYNKNALLKFIELRDSVKDKQNIGLLSLFHYAKHKTSTNLTAQLRIKQGVGAFCTMFHRKVVHGLIVRRGFDWSAIEFCKKHKLYILCSQPSYAQHMGDATPSTCSAGVEAKDFVGEG